MKILTPKVHGYIDYMLVPVLALAPFVLGFSGIAATLCYVLAAAHLGMSLFTAYPLGIVKVIPFKVHGAIEAAVMFGLLASPWIFGFSGVPAARNFFLVCAALVAGVWLVTNYRAGDETTVDSMGRTVGPQRNYS